MCSFLIYGKYCSWIKFEIYLEFLTLIFINIPLYENIKYYSLKISSK